MPVSQNRNLSVNWFNINVPSIFAVATAAIAIVTYMNKLDARISEGERYRVTRSEQTDNNFAELKMQLASMATIPYRTNVNELAIVDLSKRLDRVNEALVIALETIRKDIASLSVTVGVQSNKIDTLSDNVQSLSNGQRPLRMRTSK